jgi:hypothetical protein
VKKIEVYEIPVGCCAPVSSPEEAAFKESLARLKQEGAEVELIAITEQPQRFLSNPVVSEITQQEGRDAFPVTLIDGSLFLKGRYPQYEELRQRLV